MCNQHPTPGNTVPGAPDPIEQISTQLNELRLPLQATAFTRFSIVTQGTDHTGKKFTTLHCMTDDLEGFETMIPTLQALLQQMADLTYLHKIRLHQSIHINDDHA